MSADEIGLNYATAFIDALKSADLVQRGAQDLETFASLLAALPSLARVLEHPGLPLQKRQEILDQALHKIDAQPVSRRLLRLLLEKGRLGSLGSILAKFSELRDARLNVASAEVVTAVPVDGASRAEWETTISRLTGKTVRISYRTSRDLLGGALVRVGSTVYDGSLRKQLTRIRRSLLEEPGAQGQHARWTETGS